MFEGEEISYEGPLPSIKVKIVYPEGPIKWEGFDSNGNFGRIYENGCETWISKELLDDDRDCSSGGS